MNIKKDENAFLNDLIQEFPIIKEEVIDEDYLGLMSLPIGCFRRFTQKAIDTNNLDLVKKCFLFVEENFDIVNAEIKSSLYISYLAKLNFSQKSKAEDLLPLKLKKAIKDVNEYYASTSENEKLNKFLKGIKG
ncbi:MAG: DUF7674 family protein [Mucilaginibacter sp.]